MTSLDEHPERTPTRLGVVSFLNSRPLIEGLYDDPAIAMRYAVPAALPGLLSEGLVDAALIPVIDLARSKGAWTRISDACIGSTAKTLTVRVFSKVPADQVTVLNVDRDSHTSVALARLIWSHVYQRDLQLQPIPNPDQIRDCESVLLIGDKVVTTPMPGFAYQIDLGEEWNRWTGLPFVFAVWAGPAGGDHADLARRLSAARDVGVSHAAQVAAKYGPGQGWLIEFAEDYLARRLLYTLTPAAEAGMNRFIELVSNE